MKKAYYSSGSTFEQQMGYSRAVSDGDYLFVSGTTGFNYDTMSIDPDVVSQARQCLANLHKVLGQAHLDFSDVVRVTYIFPDRNDFEPCWPLFQQAFGDHPPAATMLVAELFDPAMKLEIELTARLK